jgi:molybdopterin/thiamine biosynthesis adenylyltransferase
LKRDVCNVATRLKLNHVAAAAAAAAVAAAAAKFSIQIRTIFEAGSWY